MGPLQGKKLAILGRKLPTGNLKQRKLICFVLDVPVRNLRFSVAVFELCDH